MSNKQEMPDTFKSIFSSISKDFEDFKPLIQASKKANVEPGQIVAGGFMVLLVLIFIGTADFFLTALVGIAYPSYMSFKAIRNNNEEGIVHWLMYWLIFGLLTLLDKCIGFLFSLIPFYPIIKLLFIVWLFYPKTRGAHKLYKDFIKPFMDKNREAIEKSIRNFLYKAEEIKAK